MAQLHRYCRWLEQVRSNEPVASFQRVREEDSQEMLLPQAANEFLAELLHGDDQWMESSAAAARATVEPVVIGGIDSEGEEEELEAGNDWVADQGMPRGEVSHDLADPETGVQRAVLDLAWPNGLQEGLSQPVALLLNEPPRVLVLVVTFQ